MGPVRRFLVHEHDAHGIYIIDTSVQPSTVFAVVPGERSGIYAMPDSQAVIKRAQWICNVLNREAHAEKVYAKMGKTKK